MPLYTERHGMRPTVKKTYNISITMYRMLFECCERYYENIAWRYPDECPDGCGCCGMDTQKFSDALEYEIPTLFRRNGRITEPTTQWSFSSQEEKEDEFDQYALFDFIELIAQNARDVSKKIYHSFYRHYDYIYAKSNICVIDFRKEINKIFEITGLLYRLTDDNEILRLEDMAILSEDIEKAVKAIKEPGLRELLAEAIAKHESPYPQDQKDAVEKIWDAFERIKTMYGANKKSSAETLITNIASGNEEIRIIIEEEFNHLTHIGNDFRIRHHETSKYEINDITHYDYLFNRCLSLLSLALNSI